MMPKNGMPKKQIADAAHARDDRIKVSEADPIRGPLEVPDWCFGIAVSKH